MGYSTNIHWVDGITVVVSKAVVNTLKITIGTKPYGADGEGEYRSINCDNELNLFFDDTAKFESACRTLGVVMKEDA